VLTTKDEYPRIYWTGVIVESALFLVALYRRNQDISAGTGLRHIQSRSRIAGMWLLRLGRLTDTAIYREFSGSDVTERDMGVAS
jgi:hypothetical protein